MIYENNKSIKNLDINILMNEDDDIVTEHLLNVLINGSVIGDLTELENNLDIIIEKKGINYLQNFFRKDINVKYDNIFNNFIFIKHNKKNGNMGNRNVFSYILNEKDINSYFLIFSKNINDNTMYKNFIIYYSLKNNIIDNDFILNNKETKNILFSYTYGIEYLIENNISISNIDFKKIIKNDYESINIHKKLLNYMKNKNENKKLTLKQTLILLKTDKDINKLTEFIDTDIIKNIKKSRLEKYIIKNKIKNESTVQFLIKDTYDISDNFLHYLISNIKYFPNIINENYMSHLLKEKDIKKIYTNIKIEYQEKLILVYDEYHHFGINLGISKSQQYDITLENLKNKNNTESKIITKNDTKNVSILSVLSFIIKENLINLNDKKVIENIYTLCSMNMPRKLFLGYIMQNKSLYDESLFNTIINNIKNKENYNPDFKIYYDNVFLYAIENDVINEKLLDLEVLHLENKSQYESFIYNKINKYKNSKSAIKKL